MQNLQQIIAQIRSDITGKVDVYTTIAQRTHGIPAEEATKIVLGELELFIHRLEKYLTHPDNHQAVISEVQGKNIFLEVMESGLSFSPVANHVYVSRLKGTGTAVGYKVTVEGEIHMAQKAGALDHLSETVLVQKGEQFSIENTQDGFHRANHTLHFDGKPNFSFDQFIAGYVYLVYPNGNRELSWISASRMNQLRMKSPNQGMYNDESFLQTKVMKHALRKIRKSSFNNQAWLAEEEDEEISEVTPPVTTQPPTPPVPQPSRTNEQAGQQLAESMRLVPQSQPVYTQPANDPFTSYQQPQFVPPVQPAPQYYNVPPLPHAPPVPPAQQQFRDPFQ